MNNVIGESEVSVLKAYAEAKAVPQKSFMMKRFPIPK